MSKDIVIVSAARTPVGSFNGAFGSMQAQELGAIAIKAALERAKVSPEDVDEVIFGQILAGGGGQNPARQAAMAAGIPQDKTAWGLNQLCGSGLRTVAIGMQQIANGDADIIVAGGMENMSAAPYLLTKARTGYRMGNGTLVDGMIFDGLWDPYKDVHMGNCGDACAKEFGYTREQQDEFAAQSFRKALSAQKEGLFDAEITPVSVPQKKGDALVIKADEGPSKGDPSKFASLRPAFSKDGTITAANASSINDGASALILASEAGVKKHGLTPLARITGYAGAAQAPEWFTTAPAKAMDAVAAKLGMSLGDVDLVEINEAFAVVAMVSADQCKIDRARVNVRGGAVALGHPIGASGARIVTTLTHALIQQNKKRGLASICIGGGEALALVIER